MWTFLSLSSLCIFENVIFSKEIWNVFWCCADVSGVQVGPDPEACPEGEALDDAALCAEAAQDADKIPGSSVEEE